MSKTPAETVDRLRKQAWERTVEPEHTMMLEAADVIAGLMDTINRYKAAADRTASNDDRARSSAGYGSGDGNWR